MMTAHFIEPSVTREYLINLLDYLAPQGLTIDYLLKEIPNLSADLDGDWVKARHMNKIYEVASTYLDDPYLGLKFGRQFTANWFNIVGFLAISSPDLLHALNRVSCFQALYSRIGKMVIREEEQVLVCWDAIWPRQLNSHHQVEASIVSWFKVGFSMVEKGFQPSCIMFRHVRPDDNTIYEDIFNCPVYFEQKYDAISIDKNILKQKLSLFNEVAHEALLKKSEQLMIMFDNEAIINTVEQAIKNQKKGTMPSIENIAMVMNIKPIELRSLLKKMDLNCRMLLDRVKFLESLPLLLEDKSEFVDIAHDLGFSEQSAFTRAFKRWTGCSPLAYKTSILKGSLKMPFLAGK